MDDERAQKVARAHVNASGRQGWFQSVREACRTLFPETDDWAVQQEADRPLPLAFATGDGALFRLEVQAETPENLAADIEIRRLALNDASIHVVERFVRDSWGSTVKRRTWSFTFPSEENVTFETEELSDEEGPDRLERVARAAAREAGWRIAD